MTETTTWAVYIYYKAPAELAQQAMTASQQLHSRVEQQLAVGMRLLRRADVHGGVMTLMEVWTPADTSATLTDLQALERQLRPEWFAEHQIARIVEVFVPCA